VNCPAASATAALAIFPVTTLRSLTRAQGSGVLSAFQATPTSDVDRTPTAPPTRVVAVATGAVTVGSDAWTGAKLTADRVRHTPSRIANPVTGIRCICQAYSVYRRILVRQ